MGMPGPLELLIVLVLGFLVIGVPVAAIVVLILISARRRGANDFAKDDSEAVSRLVEENRALRKELADLKARYGETPPEL